MFEMKRNEMMLEMLVALGKNQTESLGNKNKLLPWTTKARGRDSRPIPPCYSLSGGFLIIFF